ncbi:g2173 [Coccomyxa viridis]|uniref:G2173 protein n=1 Tax=Coccomyxa viridis TaxID=1274662 RepID=A0ABP1FNM9_9CHLO
MSLQAPKNFQSRCHDHCAHSLVPAPRTGWSVRAWRGQTRQLRKTKGPKRHYTFEYCGGIIAAQMAQADASQQAETPKVVVFTTAGCPHCKRAKAVLQQENVAYAEVDVSGDTQLRQELQSITSQGTVPQIFFGSKHIGGADALESLRKEGKLSVVLDKQRGSDGLPKALAIAAADALKQGSSKALAPAGTPLEEYNDMRELADTLRRQHLGDSDARSRTFSFDSLSLWTKQAEAIDESPATLAEKLLKAQILTIEGGSESNSWAGPAAGHAVLRFAADAPKPSLGQPLNAHFQWYGQPRPALEVAEELRRGILTLYDRHLAANGKSVDYKGLGADSDFQLFVDATAELQKLDISGFSRQERMAFWINMYNVLVVHALVVFGPASNTLARLKWFASIKYVIGSQEYSSNDIEHGVLRNNKPSPANLLSLVGLSSIAPKTFKAGDPRLSQCVDPEDPRIHFALVCGAKSCPPIKVYTPESLEEGLSSAAAAFVQSEVQVLPAEGKLVMSKIFQWYGGDFGSKADIITLLQKYLTGSAKEQLTSISGDPDNIELTYREYDWSQNQS